jgi:hypothetical protein
LSCHTCIAFTLAHHYNNVTHHRFPHGHPAYELVLILNPTPIVIGERTLDSELDAMGKSLATVTL